MVIRQVLKRILAAIACCASISVVGCSGRPAREPAERPVPSRVTLRAVDPAQFGAVIETYRGKVVLVDFWATWCSPCKELFPHTVRLFHELAPSGLAVISVSLDDAEDEPEVLRFLTSQQATFENLRASTGASSQSVTAFEIDDGAIPFLRLYDRTGKLRKTFSAPVKPAAVEEAVRQLLAEPGSAA